MSVQTNVWPTDARAMTAGQIEAIGNTGDITWQSVLRDAVNVYGAVQQGRLYEDLAQINLERARQGLPPIDTSAYQQGLAVGLDPATRQILQMAVIGLLGLGALWLIMRKR